MVSRRDGRRIVFARIEDEEADHDLHVIDAGSGAESQLTDGPAWDWMADWGKPATPS